MFVQDATGGLFIALPSRPILPLRAGTLIEVTGVTSAGDFAPMAEGTSVTVLGQSQVPAQAPRMSLPRLMTGAEDGQWVEVEGIVRSVWPSGRNVTLNVALSDGTLPATTVADPAVDYARLVDAKVRIHASAAPFYNRNRQVTGVHLFFPTLAEVRVLEAGSKDPFAVAVSPINEVLRFVAGVDPGHRVHVRGRVTLHRRARRSAFRTTRRACACRPWPAQRSRWAMWRTSSAFPPARSTRRP